MSDLSNPGEGDTVPTQGGAEERQGSHRHCEGDERSSESAPVLTQSPTKRGLSCVSPKAGLAKFLKRKDHY